MNNVFRLLSLVLLIFTAQQNRAALAQEPTSFPATDVDETIEEITEELKEAMLEMTREMHGIISVIETVEDVHESDEEIGEIFDVLVENIRGALVNPDAFQAMEAEVANDPELKEWSDRMDSAMADLSSHFPEAAAELGTVLQKHSMKLMTVIGESMQNMNSEDTQEISESYDGGMVSVEAADFDADEVRESMLELNEDMFEIVSSIESVEDVQNRDEKIGEIFAELAENLRSGMQNPTEMQKLEIEMQEDPKMQEWDQKINAAMEALKFEHPEAAADLDRVMEKHGQKMQQVMMEAAQQMQDQ